MTSPATAVERIVKAIRELEKGQGSPLVVALDGRSGTGKTTLANAVAAAVGAVVVPGDDFYVGGTHDEWTHRTAAANADRCIDWRRLRREALEPLVSGRAARWQPYLWEAGRGATEAAPAPVIVLDGVYSARPELEDLVDLSVLVQVPDAVRRERLKHRAGESALAAWHPVWDEAEDHYFADVRPPSAFDLVVDLA